MLPLYGSRPDSPITVSETSGDVHFGIDEVAESVIELFLEACETRYAVFTEDRGLRVPEDPQALLVIDPIDGSRPARCGFEQAMVSLACYPWVANPTLGDVCTSALVSLRTGEPVVSRRGQTGFESSISSSTIPLPDRPLAACSWAFEVAGRPIRNLAARYERLIAETSLSGGAFVFNASAFAILQVATGDLDFFLDVGGEDGEFGLAPYDVAAVLPIAWSCGAVACDAQGNEIAGRETLRAGPLSLLVARSPRIRDDVLDSLSR